MNGGTISLTASGTASLAGGLPAFSSTPFTFSSALHVAPTFTMTPSTILEALPGTVPVLTMSGLVGAVVGSITSLLAESLADPAVQPLVALLNTMIMKRVAANLGLTELPPGVVLSVRELSADNDSITLTPVLGAFGTILTDFRPAAMASVPKLMSLALDASSLSTGDSLKASTQGHISLDSPAATGGVTVLLSSDRADVIALTPSNLVVGEGVSGGSFTVNALAQPLMACHEHRYYDPCVPWRSNFERSIGGQARGARDHDHTFRGGRQSAARFDRPNGPSAGNLEHRFVHAAANCLPVWFTVVSRSMDSPINPFSG
jgi:hypothetical protein